MAKEKRLSDEEFRDKLFFEHAERKKSEKELKKVPKIELDLFSYGRKGAAGENPNELLTTPEERHKLFLHLVTLITSSIKDKHNHLEKLLEMHGFISHMNDRNCTGFKTTPAERKETIEQLQRLFGRYEREVMANKRSDRPKDRKTREALYADGFEKVIQRAGYLRYVRSRMRQGQIT